MSGDGKLESFGEIRRIVVEGGWCSFTQGVKTVFSNEMTVQQNEVRK